MSTHDTSTLISFVYKKVVEEDVWELKIVERRARRDTEKEVALNREKAFYDESKKENEARISFTDIFGDFLIAVDDSSEKEDIGSAKWHWEIGRLLKEHNVVSELTHLNDGPYQALGNLIPHNNIDGGSLTRSRKIYQASPEKEKVPDTN